MRSDEADMSPGLARVDGEKRDTDPIASWIAAGDHRRAITECARLYGVPLGRLCMAFTGCQAEAEELVQETLIAAYDGLGTWRGEGSVKSWLFGIARRMSGRHTEMKNRRQARLRLVHDTERGPGAEELSLERERAEQARSALASLKPSEREAVTLRYEAGLSFREVAAACGVDEAAARKRVSRALSRLRERLSEEQEQ